LAGIPAGSTSQERTLQALTLQSPPHRKWKCSRGPLWLNKLGSQALQAGQRWGQLWGISWALIPVQCRGSTPLLTTQLSTWRPYCPSSERPLRGLRKPCTAMYTHSTLSQTHTNILTHSQRCTLLTYYSLPPQAYRHIRSHTLSCFNIPVDSHSHVLTVLWSHRHTQMHTDEFTQVFLCLSLSHLHTHTHTHTHTRTVAETVMHCAQALEGWAVCWLSP
jgi:hypothetical protein